MYLLYFIFKSSPVSLTFFTRTPLVLKRLNKDINDGMKNHLLAIVLVSYIYKASKHPNEPCTNWFTKRLKTQPSMIMHALCFLLFLATTQAYKFTVTNNALTTPGGVTFRDKIGSTYAALRTLSDRKNVQKVSLFVDDMDGVAYTSNNEIHVSARYVN